MLWLFGNSNELFMHLQRLKIITRQNYYFFEYFWRDIKYYNLPKLYFFHPFLAAYTKYNLPKAYFKSLCMEKFVGRIEEQQILENALGSSSPELIAVTGRRRVGKTFLIRSVYRKHIVFEFSAVHNATMPEQLAGFMKAYQQAMNSKAAYEVPASWLAAFNLLEDFLTPIIKKKKAVAFFDEFPWMHTPRSNFLKAFEHFWNSYASKHPNLTVVICGSAASWMIQNVVNNRGGLHNRLTRRLKLLPFSLKETEEYLNSRSVKLDRYQLLQLYMAMGGIPEYLKQVTRSKSAAQVIDNLFFTKQAALKKEFDNLYPALFENATRHIMVIRALASVSKGMTRKEIIDSTELNSGGWATQILNELEESGFIMSYLPYNRTSKDLVYRLSDEYSLFYIKYIEKSRATGSGTWLRISESASWKSWGGYAFEAICLKHVPQIRAALGIGSIYTEESVWRHVPGKGQPGAQIDLLLDRKDYCINVCEMKFSTGEFTVTKKYAEELAQKITVFRDVEKPRKTLFLTMITTYGVAKNQYSKGIVQSELTMDILFD